jgi:opacity protein-like surface antigen
MSIGRTVALSLVLAVAAPAAARADGMIVPFFGVNFGGSSGEALSNAIEAERFDFGVSFVYMGGGVLGLELDLGYSPDFFGKTDFGGSSVLTATGNVVLGIPIGGQTGVGFRPYVLAGLGMLRSEVDAFEDLPSLDDTRFAWDFGGGAMFFFGDHVGVRGDVRYFRTFGDVDFDLEDLIDGPQIVEFTRASAGVVLRF